MTIFIPNSRCRQSMFRSPQSRSHGHFFGHGPVKTVPLPISKINTNTFVALEIWNKDCLIMIQKHAKQSLCTQKMWLTLKIRESQMFIHLILE